MGDLPRLIGFQLQQQQRWLPMTSIDARINKIRALPLPSSLSRLVSLSPSACVSFRFICFCVLIKLKIYLRILFMIR